MTCIYGKIDFRLKSAESEQEDKKVDHNGDTVKSECAAMENDTNELMSRRKEEDK